MTTLFIAINSNFVLNQLLWTVAFRLITVRVGRETKQDCIESCFNRKSSCNFQRILFNWFPWWCTGFVKKNEVLLNMQGFYLDSYIIQSNHSAYIYSNWIVAYVVIWKKSISTFIFFTWKDFVSTYLAYAHWVLGKTCENFRNILCTVTLNQAWIFLW